MVDKQTETRLMFAGKDAKADNELYKELLSYADGAQGARAYREIPFIRKECNKRRPKNINAHVDKRTDEGFTGKDMQK